MQKKIKTKKTGASKLDGKNKALSKGLDSDTLNLFVKDFMQKRPRNGRGK